MEQPVNRITDRTDVRLEENDAAVPCEDASGLAKKRPRRSQMMKDVEQNQMRNAACLQRQFISVANEVQPGIREEVGGDGLWQAALEISNARSGLDHRACYGMIHQGNDPLVESVVSVPQQRLGIPQAEVALDFDLVLGEGDGDLLEATDAQRVKATR